MAVVVEYHEHQPVSFVRGETPAWGCKYVYLDGTKCEDVNENPGYPAGWAGSRTMTREGIDAHLRAD